MNPSRLSRREFIRIAALSAGGLALAGCGSNAAKYPDRKQVRILVDSWALSGAPFQSMAERYTESQQDVEVRIEASPGGWMTKVTGQIRSDELQWSAAGVMTSFMDLQAWVLLGLVQPIEQLISASTVPGADTFLPDMLPIVKADQTYEDRVYGIPYSIECITYQWNTEMYAQAGVTAAPTTWQELVDYGQALKKHLATIEGKSTYAIGFDLGNLARNLGALLCSRCDNPYNEEGLLDWESVEMREALQFMRQLSRDGLTPPNCGEGLEIYDMWMRGRLGGLYSTSSRGVWAAKSLGTDKIQTGSIPTSDGSPHAGTVYWSNSLCVLNKAPMAQEAMDFFIYAMGPQNTDWHKPVIQSGKSPAFASTYDNIISNDPEFAEYQWMNAIRADIERSQPSPKNYFYQVQNEAWNKWRPEYLKDDSTMTEDELIQKVLKTTREIMDNVLKSVPTLVP